MRFNSFVLVVCLLIQGAAFSAEKEEFSPTPPTFSKKSKQQVKIAEEYLNSIKNLSANFIQTDEFGNIQKGTIYLSKPGKMRWEYTDPHEILIVINDRDMVHFDKKLDQISYFCSRNEFINLLIKENINFKTDGLYVKSLKYNDHILRVILGKKGSPGSLTLQFKKDPFQIKKLTIVDEAQEHIDITLLDIDHPDSLKSSYFEFTDHKYLRKKRY